ncbi:single-stranded DNA-binding protein [Actinoplanes sp. TFC3]|uniref:single-stranded DNA-binding protein n=1 Tax=Actinoplanes sp. TFC3 TaxID=1710355 RepID=UPI00082F2497|nr:single-stranded DNA-binding protein [Actinoplanes sp. TFC3]
MFDTNIVVVGNVLSPPEWRRTTSTNTLVTTFKIASTARRLDRETGQWTDGNQLRVRVNCWRRLAEGVAASVMIGDPVMVTGRLYTRDWVDSDGNPRTSYEMEASAVGHDLARGRAKFFRNKQAVTATVEIPELETKVRGENAPAITEDEAPTVYGEGVPDSAEPSFDDQPMVPGGAFEPFESNLNLSAPESSEQASGDSPDPASGVSPASVESSAPDGSSAAPGSSTADGDESDAGPGQSSDAAPAVKRVRSRTTRRQPVAA